MTATARFRLKCEIALGVILAVGTVVYCNRLLSIEEENERPLAQAPLLAHKAIAEDERQEAGIPKALVSYPYYKWEPKPLEKIKYVMRWKSSEISLMPVWYFDGLPSNSGLSFPKSGQITVLLINDTSDSLGIPSQDGDISLKFEVKLEGKWQRAQFHSESWCGNSYACLSIPPHSYVPLFGYQPTPGRAGKIRYVIKNGAKDELGSEEYDGAYSPDDVAVSAYDAMALREASLEKLKAFLLRKESPTLLNQNQSISHLRDVARDSLFSPKRELNEVLKVAREIATVDATFQFDPDQVQKRWKAVQSDWQGEERKLHLLHGFTINKSETSENAK
jgi:hypothetical protein